MPQRVQLRHSSTPGDKPASLLVAELCVNTTDPSPSLWVGDQQGNPVQLLPVVTVMQEIETLKARVAALETTTQQKA